MAYHANSSGGGSYSDDEESPPRNGAATITVEKPLYMLEHLATFTVSKDTGIVKPSDGICRLLQLEKTTGIWSQKMQLCIDDETVLIVDYETGVRVRVLSGSGGRVLNLILHPLFYVECD